MALADQSLRGPRAPVALAYVDKELDEGMREHVLSLIASELRSAKPRRDILAHVPFAEYSLEVGPPSPLPPAHRASRVHATGPAQQDTQCLQTEWMRVCEQEPMPPLDLSSADIAAPDDEDVHAWERAVDNAQTQLAYEEARVQNLELMQQHGAVGWRVHLMALEACVKRYSLEKAAAEKEMAEINRSRKYEQLEAAAKLQKLENEWLQLAAKNAALEEAILGVHAEHERLKAEAGVHK